MPWTNYTLSAPPFVADRDSLAIDSGHTIDWTNVPAGATYGVAGKRRIPAGTVMGELLSGNGSISPRVVTTNPATCILATDANEDSQSDARSGYGVIVGGLIYENLLPEATGTPARLASAVRTELEGADGVTSFGWKQFTDNSAS